MTDLPNAFPPQEHAERRSRLRAAMATDGVAAVIITGAEEVCYFSGLTTQANFVFTALVVTARGEPPTLVARQVEAPTAAVQAPACTFAAYDDGGDPADVVCEVLPERDGGDHRIGHQPDSLSFPVAVWRSVDSRLAPVTWVNADGLLSSVQEVRSVRELSYLREAGRLSDIGVQAGIAVLSETRYGGEVVGAIQQAMLGAGSDHPGFVPLVRSMAQIRLEHIPWTATPFAPTDSIFFELSGAHARYHAPLGRTVRPDGERPDDRAAAIARAGLETLLSALRPGRTASDVHRDWITTVEGQLGHPYARHHCGYLVGLGFPPSWMAGRVASLRPNNHAVLRAGMTFHIQSWILDAEAGNHALSDTALITDDGCELLTNTPRDLTRPDQRGPVDAEVQHDLD